MRIETAPPEWLRAIVETVCATLEINPAMLPTDPHLAGEKVGEAVDFARDEAIGDEYDLPIGITPADMPIAATPKQREGLRALLNRLDEAANDASRAASYAEDARDALNREIATIRETLKEKK